MDSTRKSLLIIFYRNPRIGFVKTRLAATLGNEKALEVFQKLAVHTKNIATPLESDKAVFYSDTVDREDIWTPASFRKQIQKGKDLGERMKNAFAAGFGMGYETIAIVGTDCYELTTAVIRQAFEALKSYDTVIGPAVDGGYYLLGMRKPLPDLFDNKQWSTDTVFKDTVADFESMGLKYLKLETLRDVDREEDLPDEWTDIH